MKRSITILIFLGLVNLGLIAQNLKDKLSPVQFEHVRINVADMHKSAQWYVDNVGLEIVPSEHKDVICVADKDHNFMIEFTSNPKLKTTYFDIHVDAFHLAFEGHKAIERVAEKMLANGATQQGELYRNQIGDYVINVRDLDGFTSQLLYRVKPFFSKPNKGTLRFEHFAFNTPEQKITALWYVEFMDLNIPWSKDIDVANKNHRNYRVPYVGDADGSMSLELFSKSSIEMSFAEMSHEEVHIAYTTEDPELLAIRMVYGGARIVNESVNPQGDVIVDLRDPYNFPVRIIKRKKTILKP